MDEEKLFNALKRKTKPVLLDLLEAAYHEMDTQQRRDVFADISKEIKPKKISGKKILEEVEEFYRRSLAGKYYEPFDINSKNFSDIPEETDEWFRKLDDLLLVVTDLVTRDEHTIAVKCFSMLYKLIEAMESGEEIVFADELGSWMMHGDENVYIKAYLTASSKVSTPEEYADVALPLIKRDSYSSFCNKVYSKATKIGNKEQATFLKKQVKENNIRTKR